MEKTFNTPTVDSKKAIDKLNLHLKSGEFVTVIGGNGAGKTTLINLISGSVFSDNGSILIENQNVTYLPEYKRANVIGHLFQNPQKGTAPNMTVEENMSLSLFRGQKRGMSFGLNKKYTNFFKDRLAQLDLNLENRLGTKIGLLSGGQRQAITLLMATIVKPKLLLLDEHTAALDPATADKILNLTKHIIEKDKITTLMITHNIQSALAFGTRTIMMNHGQILLDLQGIERKNVTVENLINLFKQKNNPESINDRMLLS